MAMARVDGLQYESKQQRLAGVLLEPLAFVYAPLSTRDRLRVAAAAANARGGMHERRPCLTLKRERPSDCADGRAVTVGTWSCQRLGQL